MSSRMRKTKGKTGARRSHHGLEGPRLSKDPESKTYHMRHRVCLETGMYRGEQVLDVASDKRKKLARAKQKMRDRGEEPESIDQATILQPDESVQVNS